MSGTPRKYFRNQQVVATLRVPLPVLLCLCPLDRELSEPSVERVTGKTPHLLPAHLLPQKELYACIQPFMLHCTCYSKAREHQLGVKWVLGELGCEPLSVSCYSSRGAGAMCG